MINFRYHVVSLAAVFLALALGLVVGTAALNGPVADRLEAQISALGKDNSNKRNEIEQYREELDRGQDFAVGIAPELLGGKLAGRKLAVLVLPNTSDYADRLIEMLTVADATVTAKITVNDKFFDPNIDFELLGLAEKAKQPTIQLDGLPQNSNGVETAGAQLALALLQRAGTSQASAGDVTAVLTAYAKQGYLAVDDKATGGADGTVIISGSPPVDKDAAKKNQSAVTLAEQFKSRPLVIAGTGVGDGNLISAVRGDPSLVQAISTVDNASTADGQVATALTCIERLVHNKVGQYGLNPGAAGLVPEAAR
ncbi:copper transporter [Actinoplanes sp. NPDC049548]|uniref:copper transporter n=1 Tax=Actinoplanes sp. NPDC049548 TaxID=3155152 RepID=UPI00342825E4